ncbi:MAG TPA: response regulator transcription factor [Candidatus Dormibacteraeota bacterium]
MPRRTRTKKATDRFRALVVEADPDYRSVLAHVVDIAGGQSETVSDAAHGMEEAANRRFDIVLMAIDSTDQDVEKVSELRKAAGCPLILLLESYEEARSHFEAGADQILPKPFVPGAVVGAIRAQLRGPSPSSILPVAKKIEVGEAVLDTEVRTIRQGGTAVTFSRREWELLEFFLANTNRYYQAPEVLAQAWGEQLSEEQFRSYIAKIRRKLARLDLPMQIVNQPGIGYCMVLEQE